MCESIVDDNEYEDIDIDLLTDESYTLSYYFKEEVRGWFSYHSYIPDLIFSLRNNQILSFYNNELYTHNHSENYCVYYNNVIQESYITPVLAPDLKEGELTRIFPFILDNISINADVETQEGVRELDSFLTHVSLHNSHQSTVKIPFIVYDKQCSYVENYRNYNVKRIKNRWEFNRFKNNIINVDDRGYGENKSDFIERNVLNVFCNKDTEPSFKKFIDDFIIVKLYNDNLSQKRIVIYDINFTFRIVRI